MENNKHSLEHWLGAVVELEGLRGQKEGLCLLAWLQRDAQ